MADKIEEPTPKEPRKIIQISTTLYQNESDALFVGVPTITALCNDGTVWTLSQQRQRGWEKVVDIPQDEEQIDKPRSKEIGKFD